MFPLLIAGIAGGIGYTVGKKIAIDYVIPKVEELLKEIKLKIDEPKCDGDCSTEETSEEKAEETPEKKAEE